MNGVSEEESAINGLIRKHSQIIKKLDEIKIKIADLNQAKRELEILIKGIEQETRRKVEIVEVSSDSD